LQADAQELSGEAGRALLGMALSGADGAGRMKAFDPVTGTAASLPLPGEFGAVAACRLPDGES